MLHSCVPRSFPLTVDGCTVSQAPFFVAHHSGYACKTGEPSSAAVRASSARCCPRRLTTVQPSRRQAEWSAIRKSTCPLSHATKFTVMTQDAIQFSGAVWEGSVRANPACFTGRQVTPFSSTPSHSPSKNADTKVSFKAVSTSQK